MYKYKESLFTIAVSGLLI